MKNLLLSISLILLLQPVSAQKVLPVIKANSSIVKIREGNHVIDEWGYWGFYTCNSGYCIVDLDVAEKEEV